MIENQNQNENISNFKHKIEKNNENNNNTFLIYPSKFISESNINNNNFQKNYKNINFFSCRRNINDLVVEEEKGRGKSYNPNIENNIQNIRPKIDSNENHGNNDQNKNIKNYKHYKFNEEQSKKKIKSNIESEKEHLSFNNNNNKINDNTKIFNKINNDTLNENNNIQVLLENNGNTTYIITIIRCLTNIKGFNNYYLKYKETFKKVNANLPISYALSRIIVHLFPNQKKTFPKNYSIKTFHDIIIYLNPIFKGQSTKNAIDFLIYMIGEMHEEYKIFLNKSQIENSQKEIACHNFDNFINYLNKNEYSNIHNQFAWINKKAITCWECSKEIITFKDFFTYDLEFEEALNKTILNDKNEISINDCINYASEEKNIFNIFCNNCNRRTNFIRKSTIYTSQNNLIFLIRDMEKKEVINDIKSYQIKIKINENLNLFDNAKNKNSFYSLNGLILYDTQKLEYIAYSISPIDNKWYKYSKDNIISVDIKDFINEYDFQLFPVIIFYRFEKFI